MQKMTAG